MCSNCNILQEDYSERKTIAKYNVIKTAVRTAIINQLETEEKLQ